jgi:hypothetical protein
MSSTAKRSDFCDEISDKQTRWWIMTLPFESFHPFYLDDSVAYAKGQCEISPTGYWHWHIVCGFSRSQRFSFVKALVGPGIDIQCVRNRDNALQYVWKDRTSIPFSRFDHGVKPVVRASKKDWEQVYDHAKEGNWEAICPSVLIAHYGNLKRIHTDNLTPPERPNVKVFIYWGLSRSGKSYRASQEAKKVGALYSKLPSTKWWCSYRGERCVVINEFTGKISIEHFLLWLDWAPCLVEFKGGSTALQADHFWITSNVPPHRWWPDCHPAQWDAFLQRVTNSVEFTERYVAE